MNKEFPFNVKPCPFCGKQDLFLAESKESNTGSRVVKCGSCGTTGPYGASNNELAVTMWNQRTPHPPHTR